MEPTELLGQTIADKYRVERVIGQGGMGFVLAARHLDLEQLVAIKLMRSAALAFADNVQRFMREAKVVASLRSEHVARMMDVGRLHDGSLFLVMEYLEGADLQTIVGKRGPLAVQDAVDFVLQVCVGVDEAHELGVIHRDLKPANLFLTTRPTGAPLVKVLDFGISKYRPQRNFGRADVVTQTHGTMGSPAYMSPEQIASAKYTDRRADIWSLGVNLYYLLSATLPFQGKVDVEIFHKIRHEPAPPLREQAPWVPLGLASLVHRCLEKEPDARFARVTQLAAALTPFASNRGRALVGAEHVRISGDLSSAALLGAGTSSTCVVEGPERLEIDEFFAKLRRNRPRDKHVATKRAAPKAPSTRDLGGPIARPSDEGPTTERDGPAPPAPGASIADLAGVRDQDPQETLPWDEPPAASAAPRLADEPQLQDGPRLAHEPLLDDVPIVPALADAPSDDASQWDATGEVDETVDALFYEPTPRVGHRKLLIGFAVVVFSVVFVWVAVSRTNSRTTTDQEATAPEPDIERAQDGKTDPALRPDAPGIELSVEPKDRPGKEQGQAATGTAAPNKAAARADAKQPSKSSGKSHGRMARKPKKRPPRKPKKPKSPPPTDNDPFATVD